MAGGPIFPYSSAPDTGDSDIAPGVYVGTGNSRQFVGMKVSASIGSDQVWHLQFAMPPTIPSGTMKLVLLSVADAATGAAKVNPAWENLTPTEDFDSMTLDAEGTTTVTWSTGNNNDIFQTKITLDAGTAPAGNDIIVMNITFETTSWTLAADSVWHAYIIWE